MHNVNFVQEPDSFMTLVEAHPNMVGAHGTRKMKHRNLLALK